MPLFADGLRKIERNLRAIARGERVSPVKIGRFTDDQLTCINQLRNDESFAPIDPVILFIGKHLFKSRCEKDGYTIEEVLVQISSVFVDEAEVLEGLSTVLRSRAVRIDFRGCLVRDEAVFECTQRHPHAELLSVIPKGDRRKSG